MKTNLITKLATPILLSGSLMIASPIFSQANPVETKPYEFQLEKGYTDECTSETEFYDGEIGICNEDLKDYFNIEILKKKFTKPKTLSEYETFLVKTCRKENIGYVDVKELYDFLSLVETKSDTEMKLENEAISKIEQKISAYYEAIKLNVKPKEEITTGDLAVYFMAEKKRESQTSTTTEDEQLRKKGEHLDLYKNYLAWAEDRKNDRFVTTGDYWSVDLMLSQVSYESGTENVRSFFQMRGANLENLTKEFPTKTKWPKIPLWAKISFGVIFPGIRNFLVTKYLLNGKKHWTNGDRYLNGILLGVLNGGMGGLLFDGIHPAIYPVRNFVTPFIIQPILKATKFYRRKD